MKKKRVPYFGVAALAEETGRKTLVSFQPVSNFLASTGAGGCTFIDFALAEPLIEGAEESALPRVLVACL